MAISKKKIEGDETVHHVSEREKRKKRGRKSAAAMQPPLTPMIDVTFQLLLFFLLTCEFRESEGNIPGTLPAKGSMVTRETDTPPPDPIKIRIRPSMNPEVASYEMTGVPVVIQSPRELGQYLKQRQDQLGSPDVPVVIFPEDDAAWRFVVEAFNQAVKANFTKIGFAQSIL